MFIDGSWLYHVRPYLLNLDGRQDFEIDYRMLPKLTREYLEQQTGFPIDLVRTNYFGTLAVNKPGHDNLREKQFYDMLAKRCFYHTEIFEFDFKGRESVRKENCLEVGLSVSALQQAMNGSSFDIAALLIGDFDYQPLVAQLRRMGKRVLLVSVRGANGFYPLNPRLLEDPTLFDFQPLYIDEFIQRLHYERTEQLRVCDSCGKEELTTFTSEWFYCKSCREEYRQLKARQTIED